MNASLPPPPTAAADAGKWTVMAARRLLFTEVLQKSPTLNSSKHRVLAVHSICCTIMPAQAGEWCSTMLPQWLVLTTEYGDVSYSAGSFYSAYYNFGSIDLEFVETL